MFLFASGVVLPRQWNDSLVIAADILQAPDWSIFKQRQKNSIYEDE
jgi:hypothetical protein